MSYSWFQTSQTGGQWYSDTSTFSIPWPNVKFILQSERLWDRIPVDAIFLNLNIV
jgi:hypothetical protein